MAKLLRILCVDDNEDSNLLLKFVLGMADLESICVTSVHEALRLIESEKFSLYIVDGRMPEVTGLEFCKDVRKVDKETPILIYSASAYVSDREVGMLAGANAYIVKPNIEEVVPTVRMLLEEAKYKHASKHLMAHL